MRIRHFAAVLAALCLCQAALAEPNTVIEARGAGVVRLDIELGGKGLKGVRYVFKGEDAVVGSLELPLEGPANYSITAYDASGIATYTGKGTIPGLAQDDRPRALPLAPTGDGAVDGLVVSLTRERLVVAVEPSYEPNTWTARVDAVDPNGKPLELDPKDLRWSLTDARKYELWADPRDYPKVQIHIKKDIPIPFQFCDIATQVFVCLPNGHCRPSRICLDPFVTVSAGHMHNCALTKTGVAFCWGDNSQGQLGAPSTQTCPGGGSSPACSLRPLAVACPSGAPCRFTQISSGVTLTAAIDTNGDAWWWGRGGTAHNKVTAVLAGSPVKFSRIAAGYGHACALSQSRSEVWCWGTNAYGESGLASTTLEVSYLAPYRVLVPAKFKKIVAGGEHTCAIGQTGVDVVCWGRNDSNQTSGPSSTTISAPGTATYYFQQFGGLTNILDVATSNDSTCVTLPWAAKCWGANGYLNTSLLGAPQILTTGQNQVCGLTNQQAQCMGGNAWGELGIGSLMYQSAPVAVKTPPALYDVISAGTSHTCGVTPDGDVFCWGNNTSGQVGTGAWSVSVREPSKVVAP